MKGSGKSLRFAAAHLSAIAMSASLLLAGVPRAYADDHKKCEERIEKTEAKLDEAIAITASAVPRLSIAVMN